MKSINLVLWAVGLGLQSLLVFLLFRRRQARSFPVFTCLVVFYVVRSALVYILSSFGPPGEYQSLYNFLSVADLFLQILVVIEIAFQRDGKTRRGGPAPLGRTALQLLVEAAIAAVIAVLIPEPIRIPVDRGIVFVMILMILRLVWIARNRVSGAARYIAGGFALYGATVTAASLVQNHAVEVKSTGMFAAAAYTKAGIYIAIVIFWIFTVPQSKGLPARARAR